MRWHAHYVCRASLDDPFKLVHVRWRVAEEKLAAAQQPLTRANPSNVMRKGTESQQTGICTNLPIRHHVAGIGKNCVTRVHDTFRRAGRPGRECQITNDVRIVYCWSRRRTAWLRKRVQHVHRSQTADITQHLIKAVSRSIGTPPGLGDQYRGSKPLEELTDVLTGISPVQGRVAGEPLARTRQQGNHGFNTARHPDAHSVALHQPSLAQIDGYAIGPGL